MVVRRDGARKTRALSGGEDSSAKGVAWRTVIRRGFPSPYGLGRDEEESQREEAMTKRMIHGTMWRSDSFIELSMFERLLWVGLISTADDQGRLRGNPSLVRADVFPADEVALEDIEQGLKNLERLGMIGSFFRIPPRHHVPIARRKDGLPLRAVRGSFLPGEA